MKVPTQLPNITPAQFAAIVGWVGAQAVAFGLIDVKREQLLVSAGATVLATAWKLADAWIRSGRAKVAAAVAANPASVPVAPPAPPVTPPSA